MNSYGKYLQLDKLLTSQNEYSDINGKPAHDEMLFIITHQTYELWFKQIMHELLAINRTLSSNIVPEKKLPVLTRRTSRITKIFKVINQQIDILETMTPMDFLEFRSFLGDASGFQSFQFRELEVLLGKKFKSNQGVYGNFTTEENEKLLKYANDKSLLANINKWLEKMPFLQFDDFNFWQEYKQATARMIDKKVTDIQHSVVLDDDEKNSEQKKLIAAAKTFTDFLEHNEAKQDWPYVISQRAMLSALFISLYRQEPILYLPYVLLSSLIDIDQQLAIWRHRHVMMVQRMIGNKFGTGGSPGHTYLYKTLEQGRVFSDLYQIGNFMIPYSDLPRLPEELRKKLDYSFSEHE